MNAATALPHELDLQKFVLNQSSLIEASAGTGKTYTITYLVLRLLLGSGSAATALPQGPLEMNQLLIVTFTRAATSDLRRRIREKVREARQIFDSLDSLYREKAASGAPFTPEELKAQQLEKPMEALALEFLSRGVSFKDCARVLLRAERAVDEAAICTIHSFCHRALNQIYAFEAGQAFECELVGDEDSAWLREAAYTRVWRRLFYRKGDKPSALLNLLPVKQPDHIYAIASQLSRVAYTDPEQGLWGYALKNAPHLEKFKKKRPEEAMDALLAVAEKSLERLGSLSSKLHGIVDADTLKAMSVPSDGGEFMTGPAYAGAPKALLKGEGEYLQTLSALYDTPLSLDLVKKISAIKIKSEGFFVRRGSIKTYAAFKNGEHMAALESGLRDFHRSCTELKDEVSSLGRELAVLVSLLCIRESEKDMAEHQLVGNDEVLRRLDYALNCRGEQGEHLAALIRSRYPVAMIDEFQDTDPVQFSIFRKLYLNEVAVGKAFCYLIGDPKQSIYAFRGSDIHSYLQARREVERLGHDATYTLGTNYRSAASVVAGVNALFDGTFNPEVTVPFITAEIPFQPVKAHEGKWRFYFEKERERGTYVTFVEDSSLLKPRKTCLNKDDLQALQAAAAARDVARILKYGRLMDARGRERPVRPDDIAILVRISKENELIAASLKELGISSVYYSDHSSVLTVSDGNGGVSPSPAAQAIIYLMQALAAPADRTALTRLLGSSLLSVSGDEFNTLREESSFEEEVRILYEGQRLWREVGFLAAFSYWFTHNRHRGIERSLEREGGERDMTDYYHIAELMQEVHTQRAGIQAQLRYYHDLISASGGEDSASSEAVQKRLESERSQVQVRTIHNSKGLEFPVVLMPFLWSWRGTASNTKDAFSPVVYYDVNERRQVMALSASPETEKAQRDSELEESVRLTYVALTRSCAANFLYPGNGMGSGSSLPGSFASLLTATTDPAVITAALPDVPKLFEGKKMLCAFKRVESLEELKADPDSELTTPPPGNERGQPSFMPAGAIDRSFTITSYTEVVRNILGARSDGSGILDDKHDEESVPEESRPVRELSDCRFTFPKGTVPGLFLHSLMEHCPFEELSGPKAEQLRERLCREAWESADSTLRAAWLKDSSLNDPSLDEGDMLHALTLWLKEIVTCPLLRDGAKRLTLSALRPREYITEMRYLLPVHEAKIRALDAVVKENARYLLDTSPVKRSAAEKELLLKSIGSLTGERLQGFITGSLDLTASFEVAGRPYYYVIDYKSNYLGSTLQAYGRKTLEHSLLEHRYDVQYLFYTLALHRLLKTRLADYDYDRDIGGVMYLYLRGMSATEEGAGVFHTRVPKALIERMDAVLGNGEI